VRWPWAQDPPGDDNARAADALARAKREAAAYRFHLEGDGTSFVLEPEAVLKWSNPVFGSVFGDHFLWTANGRPAVIGGFVKWYHPYHHSTAEFHSLSSAPIVGERDGHPSWAPGRPGVEWAIRKRSAEPSLARMVASIPESHVSSPGERSWSDSDRRQVARRGANGGAARSGVSKMAA
jgi:hypothetical protein